MDKLETEYWHIVPNNDLKPHVELRSCACKPAIEEENNLVIHNAYDGREFFEDECKEH